MLCHFLLLSNSFPFSGEPFLKTEAGFLPEGLMVDAWPFFADPSIAENSCDFSNVTPHVYRNPSIRGKFGCLLRALQVFFQEKELAAAFAKKGFFRNVLKAIKFAYISEIRLLSIQKWLEKAGYESDKLLIYSYWMYETAYVGARLKAAHSNFTFITRCHGYDLYEERHPNGYLPFRSFILKSADLICPISENGAGYLRKLYGGKVQGKIQIARLGTIRKAIIPEEQEKERAVVLVSCSNLVEVKRVHLIIKALKNCRHRIHWYHFGDGELRAKLETQASALPENIQCSFMGYRPNDDVQKFYAEHYIDAFINVSQSEGVPVSVMEAESYGIPIIATNVGGTSEIVHNQENGVLLDVNFSDDELLHAIDNVISQRNLYGKNALLTWKNRSNACVLFPSFYEKMAEV